MKTQYCGQLFHRRHSIIENGVNHKPTLKIINRGMLVVSARQTSPRLVSCVPNGGETRVRQRDKSWASCVGFSISNRRGNTISKCAAVEMHIWWRKKYRTLNLKKTNIMQLDPCQKWLNRQKNIYIFLSLLNSITGWIATSSSLTSVVKLALLCRLDSVKLLLSLLLLNWILLKNQQAIFTIQY